MPDYHRAYTPSGAVFLTLVTFNRRPVFADSENVQRLRWAMERKCPLRRIGGVGQLILWGRVWMWGSENWVIDSA